MFCTFAAATGLKTSRGLRGSSALRAALPKLPPMQADVGRDVGRAIAALGLEAPQRDLLEKIASTYNGQQVGQPVPRPVRAQNP